MSSADLAWRIGLTTRAAIADYRAVYSKAVLTTSVFPRAVLQVAFLTLIGRLTGETAHAFIGATAFTLTTPTIIRVADTVVIEKDEGTFARLRTGTLPLFVIVVCRSVVYVVEGIVAVILSIAIVGPMFGLYDLSMRALTMLPLYLLMAVSCSAIGIVGATFAVGRRADVLVGNATSYVLLVCAGVVAMPPSHWVQNITRVLPLRNGLAALRAAVGSGDVAGHALAEAGVAIGWAAAAYLLFALQIRRSAREGADDFS